jgi:poly(3-hydroxybutyrate) depolymerase
MRAPAPSGEAADSIAPHFAGAGQPARRPFSISTITVQSETVPVVTRDVAATPFHTLVEFKRSDIRAPSKILVPPLSGHFAVLLRDLVIGLLAYSCVHVIDWTNVRHVPLCNGQFGLDDNIGAVAEAIRGAGAGVSVVGVCQGGVAALASASLLAAAEEGDDPVALILIGAPIDPLANPTGVGRLIRDRPIPWLVASAASPVPEPHAGRGRLVCPAERQLAALLAYRARHLDADSELFRKLRHDDGAIRGAFPSSTFTARSWTSTRSISSRTSSGCFTPAH